MANPQAENGHVDIANEIMDALARTRIPGEARQVLDFIYRKTYGWHKKTDEISLSQFVEGTGLSKVHSCRAIKTLLKMNLITQKGNKMTQTYAIVKDFDVWKLLPKKVTLPKKVITVTQEGNNPLPKKVITKESIKEKKETIRAFSFLEIWKQYPERIGRKAAERHFKASVKTQEDWDNINLALKNYLASEKPQKGFIQNGSTWFNNWKDWVDYQPTKETINGNSRIIS